MCLISFISNKFYQVRIEIPDAYWKNDLNINITDLVKQSVASNRGTSTFHRVVSLLDLSGCELSAAKRVFHNLDLRIGKHEGQSYCK